MSTKPFERPWPPAPRHNLNNLLVVICLSLIGIASTGCGNGLANVSGQVTLDNQPLAGGSEVRGTVYFYPESGIGAPAVGLLDDDGRYRISTGSQRGVAPGPYLVSISATKIIPAKSPGEAPSGRPLTSGQYSDPRKSGFRVQVEPGSNEFDFELESKPATNR